MPLDPVASLLLDEAGPLPQRVLVLDDVDGALTRAVMDAGAQVRTWGDDVRDLAEVPEQARAGDAWSSVGADGWAPELVLWRLPQALAAVEDAAERLAALLPADARVVAGGRVKHMSRGQNAALSRSFGEVTASLGRQKSRVLHARGARPAAPVWPQRRRLPELDMDVVAHGATFGTNRLDDGTRLLLQACASSPLPGRDGHAVDLGCGSGIVATWLARRGWRTTGVDVSWSAVESTRLTAAANDVRVGVRREDGLSGLEPASVDLIASNPPFHRRAAKDSTPTLRMIADAGRVLRPGGELWLVFNSHLPYLPELRRHVGHTTVEARDRHYTVTRSLKPATVEGDAP